MEAKDEQLDGFVNDTAMLLIVAINEGDLDEVKRILDSPHREELLNEKDKHGNTPLHITVRINYVHIIRLVIGEKVWEKLCEVWKEHCVCTNDDGETPICIAAKLGHREAVKELIEIRPDAVEIPNSCGMNVLHLAAQVSQVRIVDYLNETENVDLFNLVNQGLKKPQGAEKPSIEPLEWGDTPLHIAARSKNFNMVISLLNIRGIKKGVFNEAGLTALDIARENTEYHESYQIIALLANYPAKRKPFLYGAPKVSAQKYENAINMIHKTYADRRNSELVIAVLLATMSFTAVFTIPGGFKTDVQKGETRKILGTPILIGIESFKLFIIFDCLAFVMSLFAVLMWQMSTPLTTGDKVLFLVFTNLLVCASYVFTACGFMAAVYTMLAHKHGMLVLFMFWVSVIVGLSATVAFFYLAGRFLLKLARFNCLRGVHPFRRDLVLESVWLKLENLGALDSVRRFKIRCLNWLYGYNLGKDGNKPTSGSAEIMSCEDGSESAGLSISVGMPDVSPLNRGVNRPVVQA